MFFKNQVNDLNLGRLAFVHLHLSAHPCLQAHVRSLRQALAPIERVINIRFHLPCHSNPIRHAKKPSADATLANSGNFTDFKCAAEQVLNKQN